MFSWLNFLQLACHFLALLLTSTAQRVVLILCHQLFSSYSPYSLWSSRSGWKLELTHSPYLIWQQNTSGSTFKITSIIQLLFPCLQLPPWSEPSSSLTWITNILPTGPPAGAVCALCSSQKDPFQNEASSYHSSTQNSLVALTLLRVVSISLQWPMNPPWSVPQTPYTLLLTSVHPPQLTQFLPHRLLPLTPLLEYELHKGRDFCLFGSFMYLKGLEQCLHIVGTQCMFVEWVVQAHLAMSNTDSPGLHLI